MADKKVRMTVEFSIDEEALQEHGIPAEEVLKHLVFVEDMDVDGFRISTNIPGMSPVSNFFLREGKVISQGFVQEWVKDDGLDRWRRMVIDEIDVNADVYELSDDEKRAVLDSFEVIDDLAKQVEIYMQPGDRNEYEALEFILGTYFQGVLRELRAYGMEHFIEGLKMVESLGLSRDAGIRGDILYIEDVEVFLGDDGELLCWLPDEDEPRVMRDDIRKIEAGDAFFRLNTGMICFAQEDAHQNFDEPDEPWIVSDDSWGGFFEEDIGKVLYSKVRALLEYHTNNKNKASFDEKLGDAKTRSEVLQDNENVSVIKDIALD